MTKGAGRKGQRRDDCTGGRGVGGGERRRNLIRINGYYFTSVIREKLSFHWRRPISHAHKKKVQGDPEEFSIGSQSTKRFHSRFRVTKTPLSSLHLVSLQRSTPPIIPRLAFVSLEYANPISVRMKRERSHKTCTPEETAVYFLCKKA